MPEPLTSDEALRTLANAAGLELSEALLEEIRPLMERSFGIREATRRIDLGETQPAQVFVVRDGA